MKYNEDALLKELRDYIAGTYNQHYATDKIQTLDLIDASVAMQKHFVEATFSNMLLATIRRELPDVTSLRFYTMVCCSFISATNLTTAKITLTDDRYF